MDIQLKKKPWFVRHKYYVSGGVVFLSLAAYTVALLFSPEKQRVSADTLGLAEAVQADFLEYVEQEGVVHPMLSLRVNSRISGYVERIVAEEGARVRQGDTLLVLSNPELLDEMEVQENALHKQLMSYREQEIEMEQKTLLLRKQVLQNRYELPTHFGQLCPEPRGVPHGHQEQGGTGGGAAGVRVQDPCGGTGTGEFAARLGGYHRAPFAHP